MKYRLQPAQVNFLSDFGLPRDVLESLTYSVTPTAALGNLPRKIGKLKGWIVDQAERLFLQVFDQYAITNPWQREIEILEGPWTAMPQPQRMAIIGHECYHLVQQRGWPWKTWLLVYLALYLATGLISWLKKKKWYASDHPLEKPAYRVQHEIEAAIRDHPEILDGVEDLL